MADAAAPQAKPSRPLGTLIFFAVAVLNLIAGGVGLFFVYKSTVGFQYASTTEEDVERELASLAPTDKNDQPVLFTMDPFMVNLAGTPQHVIRLEMSLEMLDQSGFEEIMGLGARARDTVMRVLQSRQFSDIESLQGKLFLKDQIALSLNSALKHGVVKDVYFTDFVVQ